MHSEQTDRQTFFFIYIDRPPNLKHNDLYYWYQVTSSKSLSKVVLRITPINPFDDSFDLFLHHMHNALPLIIQ
jgi:hypothetical protein